MSPRTLASASPRFESDLEGRGRGWHVAARLCFDPAMDVEWVEDLDDPRVAGYRNVKDADLRRQQGLFMAEGRYVVETLIAQSPFDADSLFVTPQVFAQLRPTLEKHAPTPPVYLAEQELFNEIVGFNLHRGCLGLGQVGSRLRLVDVVPVEASRPSTVVVLEGLTNTENVGAAFRNALAFGADAVVLCPRSCDPLYRKSIRVSMGATLRVPFARAEGWPDALDELRAMGHRLLALHPGDAAVDLFELDAELANAARVAFVLGAEGEGLSHEALERADLRVRIAMRGDVDSVNVATASGIALHHLFALRGGAAGIEGAE